MHICEDTIFKAVFGLTTVDVTFGVNDTMRGEVSYPSYEEALMKTRYDVVYNEDGTSDVVLLPEDQDPIIMTKAKSYPGYMISN